MVARTLLTKLGRICEISFKNCHLPWWLDDIVNALGVPTRRFWPIPPALVPGYTGDFTTAVSCWLNI